MNDPRKIAGWKQLRAEARNELLLGAILDALLPAVPAAPAAPVVVPPAPAKPVTTRRKANA